MDRKTITIFIAVILVLATVGVASIMLMNSNDDRTYETGRLVIYGNANNDDFLDSRDVSFIQDIVDKRTEWNKVDHPFADTNTDGEITKADIDLLNKFLKKETSTMYYYDYAGTIQHISYPITGKIAVYYNYGLDASIILGCYDRVVGATNSVLNTISNTETRYPGIKSLVNIGNPQTDPEALLKAEKDHDIKAVFGIGEAYVTEAQTNMANANSKMDIITLNTSGYKGKSCDYIGGIITLGVMFGCEENAKKYVDYCDRILNNINEKTKGLDVYSLVVPHNTSNAVDTPIRTSAADGSIAGNVYTLSMLPLNDLFAGSGSRNGVEIETIITMDPDIIIFSTWAYITDSMTYDEAQIEFEKMAGFFSHSNAYKDKKIFCATFESFGTYSGMGALPLLASFIWPDLFDEEEGWKELQYYYDTFTKLDIDVKKVGCFAPHKLAD